MSGHNEQEKESWKRAAKAEGVTLSEFKRLAANDRAAKILDPFKGAVGGIAKSVFSAVIKEFAKPQEKVCQCGHAANRHVAYGGNAALGSCGGHLCDCKKFVEGRKSEAGK